MKILLISPNIETLPDPVFPLGLAYLAAAVKKNGMQYRMLDLCFAADCESAVVAEINDYHPDCIGLSLRNLDNVSYPGYFSYLSFYRRIVAVIRCATDRPIIVGGSAFTLMPKRILDFLQADYGVAGEGEHALIDLMRRLDPDRPGAPPPPGTVLGDSHADLIKNLDDLPYPDRSGLDSRAYLRFGGMGNIQTKRGCPFHCIYCTYPLIEGRRIRLRSPKKICNEIEIMKTEGIRDLFVVDNEFNFPVEHAQFVCHEMRRRDLNIRWSAYANPRYMTPKLAEAMGGAGCTGIEFGSDAADAAMLVNMGKNFSVSDLVDASKVLRRTGISFCHSLLLGGPGETMDSVRRTFDTVLALEPTAVICMIGIRIFPRTALYRLALGEGRIDPADDLLQPAFYLSSAVEDHILPFIENFSREHPTWIFPGMNININRRLQEKIRRLGVKGPLWEYMQRGRRFKRSPDS